MAAAAAMMSECKGYLLVCLNKSLPGLGLG